MNKFFIFILCLCCALTVAQATGEDRLNDSDANVFGHVLDKKTGENIPFIKHTFHVKKVNHTLHFIYFSCLYVKHTLHLQITSKCIVL